MSEPPDRIRITAVASAFVNGFLRRSRRRNGRRDLSQTLVLAPDAETITDHNCERRYVLCTKKDSGFRGAAYTDVFRREVSPEELAAQQQPSESGSASDPDIPPLSRSSVSSASSAPAPGTPGVANAAASASSADPALTPEIITERLRRGHMTTMTYEAVFRVSRSSVVFCGSHIIANARTAMPPRRSENTSARKGHDADTVTASAAAKEKPTFPYFATENWHYSAKAAGTQKVSLAMGCSVKNAVRMWRFYPCFGDSCFKRLLSKVGPSNFECIEEIEKKGWYWYQVYSHNNSNRIPIAYESLSETGQSRLVISEFMDAEMTDCMVSMWLLRLNSVGFIEATREASSAERCEYA